VHRRRCYVGNILNRRTARMVIITARRAALMKRQPLITQRSRRAQQVQRKEARTRLAMNSVGRNAGEHDFSER